MSVSVFDHPLLSGLLGDDETAAQFSIGAEIGEMLRFEAALARAQAAEGVISAEAAEAIAVTCRGFAPDMDRLRADTARDGVVVPGLVRQLRDRIDPEHAAALHRGPTSQDLIDTSLVLRLRHVAHSIDRRLQAVVAAIDDVHGRFGQNVLVARTRMQRALDIKVASRLAAWRDPLVRARRSLPETASRLCYLQMGGPTGTLDGDGKWPAVKERMGIALDLPVAATSWHSQRDSLVAFADCLARISGSLGKLGQDVALMVQDEIAEVALAGGGSSSSMPHKNNPIGAEILVALAHYNAVQISGMHHAMIHEQERSGAAWTLEWMVLPSICVATAAGLATAGRLLIDISAIGRPATD